MTGGAEPVAASSATDSACSPGKTTRVQQVYGDALGSREAPASPPQPLQVAPANHAPAPEGARPTLQRLFGRRDTVVQRHAAGGGAGPDAAATHSDGPAGSGSPMLPEVRRKMERAFGADFSGVRIHEGSQAQAIGALAYAKGTDIHFAPGQYDPSNQRGQELLGHELTHVVQQAQHRVAVTGQAKGVDHNDDPVLEREADEMGARAAREQPATLPAAPDRSGGEALPDAQAAQSKSAGDAHHTQLTSSPGAVVQRNNDDWALESTKNIRRELDTTPVGKEFEFRFDHGDKAGFGSTLHHHISRAKMTEIVASYKASQRAQSKMKRSTAKDEYEQALSKFHSAVDKIAKEAELDTTDLEARLHNLPLNLHYGPSIVKDDPGEGFDPSTRPKEGTDGQRELEPTSQALLAFLTSYQNAVDALAPTSDGALDGAVWSTLTEELLAAHELYKRHPNLVVTEHGSIPVNREQWVKTGDSDTWAKRGTNTWPALKTAQQRFAERTGPLGAGGPALSAHHDFTVPVSGGGVVTIRIGYSGNTLTHFCNRHTYRHFDPAQIKLVNTFFAAGTNQAAVILHARNAFALVEAKLRQLLPSNAADYEITGALIEALAQDGLNFTANDRLLAVTDRDDLWGAGAGIDGAVDLVQMSPTGSTYESYDAALMNALNLR